MAIVTDQLFTVDDPDAAKAVSDFDLLDVGLSLKRIARMGDNRAERRIAYDKELCHLMAAPGR